MANKKSSPAETAPAPTWNGAIDALQKSWRALSANPTPAYIYICLSAAANIIASLIMGESTNSGSNSLVLGDLLLGSFIELVIFFVLLPFAVRYELELARGNRPTVSELLRSPPMLYANLIGTAIILGLLCLVGIIPLLIPLIWVLPWIFIAPFVVVDSGCGPIDAVKQAHALLKHNLGKAWALIGLSIFTSITIAILSSLSGSAATAAVATIAETAITLLFNTAGALLFLHLRSAPRLPGDN